jgi:RpiR family transcriptional regulator, carbohydrate utilization regulator
MMVRSSVSNSIPACLVRIRHALSSLTEGERRVADIVLQDPQGVTLSSVTVLAQRSKTSTAAVSRFCRKLGFGTFPQFKIRLAHDLAQPIPDIHEDIKIGEPIEALTRKVFQGNIQTLTDTLQVLDPQAVADAVALLATASRVLFFGYGASAVVAQDANHKFIRTGKTTLLSTDKHVQLIHASLAGPRDVIVAISHTGRTRDLLEVLRVAKQGGARTIAITHYGRCPILKLADVVLQTSARETAFRQESLSSRVAALTIIDALYVGVGLRLHEAVTKNLGKIRRALRSTRV